MDFNMSIAILFGVYFLTFFVHGIEGRKSIPTKQQQLPYPPTNATAKTIYGDIYDCIPKMSQLGFKNSAIIEMDRMNQWVNPNDSYKHKTNHLDLDKKIWVGKRCPTGTVPISRKNGRIQKTPFPTKSLNQSLGYDGGTEFVGIAINQGELLGAYAEIALWLPEPVHPGQYSAASILIENGPDVVEAGWIVHPDLYGDSKTRFYTAWRSVTGGSYNVDFPGFVVVDEEFPLNYMFPRTSDASGASYQVAITIQKGREDGNWYLFVNCIKLGYWRGEVIPNLANSATTIRFGGQVYSHPPTKNSPPMGSGVFANFNPVRTCYMQNIHILLNKYFEPPSNYQKIAESRCYMAGADGNCRLCNIDGFHFVFGGSGGIDTCL